MKLEGVELDRVVRKALQISVKTVGRAVPEGEPARLRDEAKDLRSAIERRDEIIDGLKAEVERLRNEIKLWEMFGGEKSAGPPDFRAQSRIAIAGQLANSNAPIQQAEMSKAIKNLDQLTSIRIEENHGD